MRRTIPGRLMRQTNPRTEPGKWNRRPHFSRRCPAGLDHKSAPVLRFSTVRSSTTCPQELLLGDFVSRPFYLDRGDNNPEQIITARIWSGWTNGRKK